MVEKFLKLLPCEKELLERTVLEDLAPLVAELDLGVGAAKKRPIRCRLPADFAAALSTASSVLRKPKVQLLIRAARTFRRNHPVELDWKPPTEQELIENDDRDLADTVFYLDKDDRDLIQNLGRGVTGIKRRREAFQALIPILRSMVEDLSDSNEQKRITVRAQIPAELDCEITKRTATGDKYVRVLLEACRHAKADAPH
jgi:hypothetical protein